MDAKELRQRLVQAHASRIRSVRTLTNKERLPGNRSRRREAPKRAGWYFNTFELGQVEVVASCCDLRHVIGPRRILLALHLFDRESAQANRTILFQREVDCLVESEAH